MYLKDEVTKEEIWVRPSAIQAIEHPEPTIFVLIMNGGQKTRIYFEGGLRDLIKHLSLLERPANTGVKVMTSRDSELNAKYFIVRDNVPKYFGDQGWTDKPFLFDHKPLADAIAANL